MQKYCEPYFSAIEKWRRYESLELVQNRIQMIETALKILSELSQQEETYNFELVCEKPEAGLLDEVIPTPGKDYIPKGDMISFQAAKNVISPKIFQRVGIFFQGNLLKAIAGWSDAVLKASNHETRRSVILAIEMLFRIPESAGVVHFVYSVKNVNDDVQKRLQFPASPLTESGKEFFDFLSQVHKQNLDAAPIVVPSTSEAWTTDHPSVGRDVAASFKVNGKDTLFLGKITKYLHPSKPSERDQLYHVQWEDADEQTIDEREYKLFSKWYDDYKKKDLAASTSAMAVKQSKVVQSQPKANKTPSVITNNQKGDIHRTSKSQPQPSSKMKKSIEPDDEITWTRRHDSVGREVAGVFQVPSGKRGSKQEKKVFRGKVVRYCPPSKPKSQDQLYHVVWEDGDEQDFDEAEFRKGVELFIEHFADDVEWISDHPAVGLKVSAYFALSGKKRKLFVGTVQKYAPPSANDKEDQLYHVVWEDGDEQDYDEAEYQEARALYEANVPSESNMKKNGEDLVDSNKGPPIIVNSEKVCAPASTEQQHNAVANDSTIELADSGSQQS